MVLRMNQVQMMSYMSMMGGGTTGMWEQKTEDGKTYGEQTKDSVLEQLKAMMLLKEHAADYKVSVSDEEKKSIEEAVKNSWKRIQKKRLKSFLYSSPILNSF